LVEKDGKRLARQPYLRLCTFKGDKPDRCDDGAGLGPFEANTVARVFVGPLERVGTFDSQTLTIGSDQKPDGDGAVVSVSVSSWWHKLIGVAVIFAGVCISWLLTVYIRGRIAYNEAYLPVLALRRSLDASDAKLTQVPEAIPTRTTRDAIQAARDKLSETELENHGMPPRTALPWTAPGAPGVEQFRQYVQALGDRAAALAVICGGFAVIGKAWTAAAPAAKTTIEAGATSLDGLSAKEPPPASADIEAAIDAALQPPAKSGVAFGVTGTLSPPAMTTPRPAVTEESLRVEITSLGAVSWLTIMVVTVALGAYIMIYSAAGNGFGRIPDYLLALFWGLGLPAASQLTNATSGTVKTTFNVAGSSQS
jgi:hypothetical protein